MEDDFDWVDLALQVGAVVAGVAAIWWLGRILRDLMEVRNVTDLIPAVRDQIGDKPVLILGDLRSGKSALLLYMERGRPTRATADGLEVPPDRTFGAVIVNKKLKINQNKLTTVLKDVAGDQRELWEAMLQEIQPAGIIYMIDARPGTAAIEAQIDRIDKWILDVYRSSKMSLNRPKTLQLFLNFADEWAKGKSAMEVTGLIRYAEDHLTRLIEADDFFVDIQTGVSKTSLAPRSSDDWREVRVAVDKFGALLGA